MQGGYQIAADGTVGFVLGAYDSSRPLVIDPVLVYGTWLGGPDTDQGNAIAVDSTGAAYVTGYTSSASFPGTAAGNGYRDPTDDGRPC